MYGAHRIELCHTIMKYILFKYTYQIFKNLIWYISKSQ